MGLVLCTGATRWLAKQRAKQVRNYDGVESLGAITGAMAAV